jgi:hypothetical protein
MMMSAKLHKYFKSVEEVDGANDSAGTRNRKQLTQQQQRSDVIDDADVVAVVSSDTAKTIF